MQHGADLLHQQLNLHHIARLLQAPSSTVARLLSPLGLGRSRNLHSKPPVQRFEWERPSELIHIDIKSLARFQKMGHRITVIRQSGSSNGVGYAKEHVAVDGTT